jgi:hypothetical protein
MTKMNSALILLFILLLGIILCSFLGGRNCLKEGITNNTMQTSATSVTGPNGNTAGVVVGPQGNVFAGTNVNGNITIAQLQTIQKTTYYGPNGGSATVTQANGSFQIIVKNADGSTSIYTYTPPTSSTSSITISSVTFYGPYGGKARLIVGSGGNYFIRVYYPDGHHENYNSSSYNGTTSNTSSSNTSSSNTSSSNTASSNTSSTNTSTTQQPVETEPSYPSYSTAATYPTAGAVTGPYGNSAGYVTGPMGNTFIGTSSSNSSNYDYSSSLPQGIPSSMIPSGDEDLYILKSEVVPPVCPACPTSSACPRTEKPPPCPACARCPEPAFECKKVPNYNAINKQLLPMPVLNDFSTFGM